MTPQSIKTAGKKTVVMGVRERWWGTILRSRAFTGKTARFAALADYVAIYAGQIDKAWVGDLHTIPQPGNFFKAAGSSPIWTASSRMPPKPSIVRVRDTSFFAALGWFFAFGAGPVCPALA
jgi:hypothetical protein